MNDGKRKRDEKEEDPRRRNYENFNLEDIQDNQYLTYLKEPENEKQQDNKMMKKKKPDYMILNATTSELLLETGCILFGRGHRYERKIFHGWDEGTIAQYKMYKMQNQKELIVTLYNEKIERIQQEQLSYFMQEYQKLPKELKHIITHLYPEFIIELSNCNHQSHFTYLGGILLEIWLDFST